VNRAGEKTPPRLAIEQNDCCSRALYPLHRKSNASSIAICESGRVRSASVVVFAIRNLRRIDAMMLTDFIDV
jgi:hypothetical protein